MGVVEPEENEQLSIYAIGMMDTIAGYAYNKVVLVVHQPRAPHVDGPVREWTATPGWFEGFRDRAKAAAEASRVPNAVCVPGDWCEETYCPAQASCPALNAQAQAIAKVDFAVQTPETAVLPDVATMAIEQVAAGLKWEKAVTSMFKAMRERIGDELNQGKDVPGFMLVEANTNRKVVDAEAIGTQLELLYSDEQIYKKKLVGIGAIKKLVGTARFAEFEAQGWIAKPPGALTVVPTSDKREPRTVADAKEDFKPVIEIEQKPISIFDGFDDEEKETTTAAPVWPTDL